MSTKEFLAKLNADQLQFAINEASALLLKMTEVPKEEYWCVGDSWMNIAFFKKEDKDKALECFIKEFSDDKADYELKIELVKLRPDEVEGLLR